MGVLALGEDTGSALGSLPYLDRPNMGVSAFGAPSLLIGLTAMAVGGAEDAVLVKAVGLLESVGLLLLLFFAKDEVHEVVSDTF